MRPRALVSRPGVRALLVGVMVALSLPAWTPPAAAQSTAATPGPSPTSSPGAAEVQSLRERAAAFWAAKIAGDVTKQWELLEPRGQARQTPGEYAGGGGAAKYLAYEIDEAAVKGYFATVKVRLLVLPYLPGARRQTGPTATVLEDAWVRIRGTWYRSLEQR